MKKHHLVFRLAMHKLNCEGSATDRLFPFVQADRIDLLNGVEREYLYTCIRHIAIKYNTAHMKMSNGAAVGHYGYKKAEYLADYMLDRVLQLYDIIKTFPDWENEGVAKIQFSYKKLYPHYEALLQMARVGIQPPTTRDGKVLNVRQQASLPEVAAFVLYFAAKRRNLTGVELMEARGHHLSYYLQCKTAAQMAQVEAVCERASLGEHKLAGFGSVSLDDENLFDVDEAESIYGNTGIYSVHPSGMD